MKKIIKKMIISLLRKKGYRIIANNLYDWPNKDSQFKKIFLKQVRFGWHGDNGPKIQRMYMVRNLLLSVKNLKGNWAECGVFKGSTSLIMAEYNNLYSILHSECNIHLFDSFEGLSDPANEDFGTNMVAGDYLGSEDEVKKNLKSYRNIIFHRGWIPDRFADVKNKKFSFVHIDVDFYQPVKESLNFFLPRMVKGGIVVLDDYGCEQTPGAMKATDEIASKYGFSVARLAFGQAFIIAN
jgi:O-methyltransferase